MQINWFWSGVVVFGAIGAIVSVANACNSEPRSGSRAIPQFTPSPFVYTTPVPLDLEPYLKKLGRQIDSTIHYKCVTRGKEGACIGFNNADYATQFFAANFETQLIASFYLQSDDREISATYVETCILGFDATGGNVYLNGYSDCEAEMLPTEGAYVVLAIAVQENWPELTEQLTR